MSGEVGPELVEFALFKVGHIYGEIVVMRRHIIIIYVLLVLVHVAGCLQLLSAEISCLNSLLLQDGVSRRLMLVGLGLLWVLSGERIKDLCVRLFATDHLCVVA